MLNNDEQGWLELHDIIKPNFASAFAGFSIPNGWVTLVAELHEKLIERDPHYLLAQAKEKFGSLRYYIEVDRTFPEGISDFDYEMLMDRRWAVHDDLDAIINEYEKISMTVCQSCGSRDAKMHNKGWVATLCDACLVTPERGY